MDFRARIHPTLNPGRIEFNPGANPPCLNRATTLAAVSVLSLTSVTLVSNSQLRWRGVAQGVVPPVFPFRAHP